MVVALVDYGAGNLRSAAQALEAAGAGAVCVTADPRAVLYGGVFLLFLALLPQFTDPLSTWPIPAQIIALGSLHAVSCAVVYLLVGFSAQAVLQTRPGAAKKVSRVSGTVMILIALGLLAEQVLR